MVSALDSGSSGPGSRPGRGHCVVVLLGKTLLHPRARSINGYRRDNAGGTCDGPASHPGGVTILLVASCYRKRDMLR